MSISASDYPKICFVKTAWSDTYQDVDVFGRHSYIQRHKDGHERFNFMVGAHGLYCGYVPPHKTPEDSAGWLVIFVAASTKDNGHTFGPLLPVGWYEDATFKPEDDRPEYKSDPQFKKAADGLNYRYSIVSNSAFLIPDHLRNRPLPMQHGRKLGMASKVDVRSSDLKTQSEQWRKDYAQYAMDLLDQLRPTTKLTKPGLENFAIEGVALTENPSSYGYASSEFRRKVELAAEIIAKNHFRNMYHIKDVTKENLGYDFRLTRKGGSEVLLLEVKGTSSHLENYYLTRGELRCLRENEGQYRLFLVTSALGDAPKFQIFNKSEIDREFDLEPLSYHVKRKV